MILFPEPSSATPADDEPLTLAEACCIFFKNKIKPSTLRKLAVKGDLVIERIGRRHFVTPAAIKEMREKCRVGGSQKDHDSGLSQKENMPTAEKSRHHGVSVTTADTSVALASFRKSAIELSKRFSNTSLNDGKSSQGS